MDQSTGAVAGPDGQLRCPWALGTADMLAYHDDEWGRPVRDDRGLFEKLCLEAFQSGLSWLTILRKRENFRAAFAGFEMAKVAAFGPADVDRLLADAGIVRNRAKIEAAIANAGAALGLPGGLAALVWKYAEPGPPAAAAWATCRRPRRRPRPCRPTCAATASASPGRSPPTPPCRRAAWSTITWSTASAAASPSRTRRVRSGGEDLSNGSHLLWPCARLWPTGGGDMTRAGAGRLAAGGRPK